MNILFITNELGKTNGWATVGTELIAEMRQHHNVIAFSRQGDDTNIGNDLIAGDNYKNLLTLMRDTFRVLGKLQGHRIDAIVCNAEPYLPLATMLKTRLGNPRLMLLGHGTYIYYPFVRGARRFINRWFARYLDVIVVPSQYTYDKVRAWWHGPLAIVHWGVNAQDYYPIAGVAKEQAFICVGALKERKGVGTLLRAFAAILKRYPQTKLYLVGVPAKKYSDLSSDLDIARSVVFTGKASHAELRRYYSTSLCHILVSVNTESAFEGYGLVHLEANACGIPSIGAAGTANEDVIEDGYNGYLCAQNDSGQLAMLMERILEAGSEYQQMCANALRHAQARTWHEAAAQLLALI
ncbi:MAG: glycosyltransferase family 4 protein [Sulfuricaulis sp.]